MRERRTPYPEIVTVGEALVDMVAPEAEDLERAITFLRTAGGAPANVAVAAARLQRTSALVGAVGRDAFGVSLRRLLAENGVDVEHVLISEHATSLAVVAGNWGGIPDFVFYRGADATLQPRDLPVDLLVHASFVHLSSMALMSEPSASATLTAAEQAREGGALVSVDPNLRPSSWASLAIAVAAIAPLVEAADVLKVNDEEAKLLTGYSRTDDALAHAGRHEALVLVTCGADGCLWRWQDQSGHIPAPRVEVADTTGAGDAFIGAVLAELCRRDLRRERFAAMLSEDVEAVVRYACAAGSLSCTRTGAMPSLPTQTELELFLSHRES